MSSISGWKKLVIGIALVACWFGVQSSTVSAMSSGQLVELTNQQRTAQGLPKFSLNDRLNRSAHAKAQHMLANNYWSHDAPDGTEPWQFVEQSGYDFVAAGENLAKGFLTDQGVINAWMNSPSHRDNILSARYEEIGIAIIQGSLIGEETTLIVVHYGQPAARKSQPQPVSVTTKPQQVSPTQHPIQTPNVEIAKPIEVAAVLTVGKPMFYSVFEAYRKRHYLPEWRVTSAALLMRHG